MSDEPLVRKLSAILYADVVDYSRLTGEDEEGTHRLLSEYLDRLSAHVKGNNGRVVHYAGDAMLAEFDADVDAVSCGVDVQTDLHARNQALPEERRVWFRIGINLGDVIVDLEKGAGADMFGRSGCDDEWPRSADNLRESGST
jgi:class 3 adenylate cyclase